MSYVKPYHARRMRLNYLPFNCVLFFSFFSSFECPLFPCCYFVLKTGMSQTMTSPPTNSTEANAFPSGLNATQRDAVNGKVISSLPVSTDQKLILGSTGLMAPPPDFWSSPLAANIVSLGKNATDVIKVGPLKVRISLPVATSQRVTLSRSPTAS